MPFNISIPQPDGQALSISLDVGHTLFVLGANGTGKSSLMHRLYASNRGQARQISAHRQTWFASNAVTLSPQEKRNTENNLQNVDATPQARWKDDYSAQRASIAIYDLIDAENVRARAIAGAMDSDNVELARALTKRDAPIKVINELLRLSNMPVEISVHENEQVLARKGGGAPYSIAELSDGERNALLLAANVLTVKPGTLILVDEPERHLHRSIVSPLLTLLFAKREDCAFVVSTHEVMLPLDNPDSQVALIRSCQYQGSSVVSWEVDLVASSCEMDEQIRRDILGARRVVLLVEGTAESLDQPLYSLLFPGVSVVSKASCRDVQHAVIGIRGAADLHWMRAFGIVDNDWRPETEHAELRAEGVFALPVYSVESLYYHPEVQSRLAQRHAAVTGDDPSALLQEARAAALAAISPHVARLSERRSERLVREAIFTRIPTRKQLREVAEINVSVDVASIVLSEEERLRGLLEEGNLDAIIAQYPVRETGALGAIAGRLGFKSREQYEAAVRKLMVDDESAVAILRGVFGALASEMAKA